MKSGLICQSPKFSKTVFQSKKKLDKELGVNKKLVIFYSSLVYSSEPPDLV